jgi:hypothetical protein
MAELSGYDRELVVGILGGGAGTTHDAFHQLHEAKQNRARVALYGRKIKAAEHPLLFVQYLRRVVDGILKPSDAVIAYHRDLETMGIDAFRSIEEDLILQNNSQSCQ